MARWALWCALLLAPAAAAQDSLGVQPPAAATVRGRVVIPAGEKVSPVAGAMVTVHRVGPEAAGPLDSTRTGADGRYTLRYTRFGSDQAVYFAAVVHRGVAYFSPPLRGAFTGEEEGEIVVFDTTAHPVPFSLQGHHIVVAAPGPDGSRKVIEVYEVSNDSSVTAVGKDSLTAVWSAALPAGATGFAPGEGDVAAVALVEHAGRAEMRAPFGPGIKQLSFSYTLPPGAFPVQYRVERITAVLEVLLEEMGAQVLGPSLRSQGNATTQGRTFKRFLAENAPPGEVLRIDVPVVAASTRTRVVIGIGVLFAVAMAASLARALRRRRGEVAPASPAAAPRRSETLIAAIAALDARRDAGDPTLAPAEYATERAALKMSLAAALDAERK